MCYYQPILFECPTCHNVFSRGGENRECEDYIRTRDREMGRMQKWREGSRERAPPTPFIFGWCRKNGQTEKPPVVVVSERACEPCLDAGWSRGSNRPSPSGSETSTSTSFTLDRYLSPKVQAPPSPVTSIEGDLDDDKLELGSPMSGTPADSEGRQVRQSERIRAREEKKTGAVAQNRTTGEQRGRPTSTRRR